MIPRIRARVGHTEDGKFYFEISLWNLAGTECFSRNDVGPFQTEKEAHIEMRKCTQLVSESIEKMAGGKPSGKYIDFKDGGLLKSWMQQ